MTTQYYVLSVEECSECDGTGVVYHPLWAHLRLLPDFDAWTQSDVEAWFRERGYAYPPDEEITCSECDGKGGIERDVPLLVALKALGR